MDSRMKDPLDLTVVNFYFLDQVSMDINSAGTDIDSYNLYSMINDLDLELGYGNRLLYGSRWFESELGLNRL